MAKFKITGLYATGEKVDEYFESHAEAKKRFKELLRSIYRSNLNLFRLDDNAILAYRYQLDDDDYKRLGI